MMAEHLDQQLGMSDSSTRLASLPGRLSIVERIMAEAICDPEVSMYRPRAQFTFFCGDDPENVAGHEFQLEVVGRCLEWFVFDYKVPDLCQTPAQHWFANNSKRLSKAARQDAANCLDFVLSIFEITEVDDISGFVAVDLLRNGRTYYVDEHIINSQLQPGQMLLGRLFPHNQNYSLSGMATIMDSQACSQVRAMIKNGKLRPDNLLQDLDGLELENLYGRSLMGIDKLDATGIEDRVKHYLDITHSSVSYSELVDLLRKANDPVDGAVSFCRKTEIECRHEIELMIAYLMGLWFKINAF